MTGEFRLALAVDREIRRRAAAVSTAVAQGLVVRHPRLFDVHYLNAVLLDAAPSSRLPAEEIVTLADRWLGDCRHRHVVFDDAAAGERVAAALAGAGWERQRTLYMALGARAAADLPVDPRAREISDAELLALQVTGLREEVPQGDVRSGLLDRLIETQAALHRATPARCFGAGEPAEPLGSMCTVFLTGEPYGRRAAMISEVGTLVAARGRGLAKAVVAAAARCARDWGAELIAVPADADDWPQLMYARLGFEPLGRQVELTLRLAPRGSGETGV